MFHINKLKNMKNISLDQEPIELTPNIDYVVIDALYINDIKKEIPNLDTQNIFGEIRTKVFPYTETPFAEYKCDEKVFSVSRIRKIDFNEIESTDIRVFSSDSGAIVFVNKKIFLEFVSRFDYNELTDATDHLLNINYWKNAVSAFDFFDTAIIVAPGVESQSEFDGSGIYRIA